MPKQKIAANCVATEKKKRHRKKKVVLPPPCWTICSELLSDKTTDYVRICLDDVFVTQEELNRMLKGVIYEKS